MSINESSMWAAVHRMESASEQIARAAEEITQAVQRFAFLLEPGYGGNGLRLIELLEQTAPQPEQSGHVSVPKLAGLQSLNHQLGIVALSFKSSEQTQQAVRELRALLNGGEA